MVYRTRETLLEYIKRDLSDGKHSLVTRNNVILNIELYNLGDAVYATSPVLGTDPSRMLVLKCDNLTINSGVTLTPAQACKGMCIYVKGELVNNGTISMTARGGTSAGQNVYLYENEVVTALGAAGGASQTVTGSGVVRPGANGINGNNRSTGGGGAGAGGNEPGGLGQAYFPGSGSSGTSYSGGVGGGAAWFQGFSGSAQAGDGAANGGAGGYGTSLSGSRPVGGGAGNPGGEGSQGGSFGSTGTGGLLIVFANILANNGTISSNGSNGGAGANGGGGSSGGGSINIFYVLNPASGSITANGGASVNSSGAGGDGSVSIDQIPKEALIMSEQVFVSDLILEEVLTFLHDNSSSEIPFMLQPQNWIPGVEYEFADGSFGQMFVGTITATSTTYTSIGLGLAGVSQIISSHTSYDIGNGSRAQNVISNGNLGGVSVSAASAVNFSTTTSAARTNAPYDVWLRYTKTA